MIGALLNDCDQSGTSSQWGAVGGHIANFGTPEQPSEMLQTGVRREMRFRSDRFKLTGHLPPGETVQPYRFVWTSHTHRPQCKIGSASRITTSVVIMWRRSVPLSHQCYVVVRQSFEGRFVRRFDARYRVQRSASYVDSGECSNCARHAPMKVAIKTPSPGNCTSLILSCRNIRFQHTGRTYQPGLLSKNIHTYKPCLASYVDEGSRSVRVPHEPVNIKLNRSI